MLIPIQVTTYTAKIEGKALREVTCESCGQEYVYVLHIRVKGTSAHPYGVNASAGPENARADAEAKYRKRLKDAVDLAPCPRCGWIQENMHALARRMKGTDYLQLLVGFVAFFAGIGLLGLLPFWGVLEDLYRVIIPIGLAVIMLAALAVFFRRLVADRRWHPNDAPAERRLAIAAKISIPREEYLKALQRQEGGTQE
jgi:hypothetical protein